MKLVRTLYKSDGIFGRLYDANGKAICYTLEHAYLQADGSFRPKLGIGEYSCVRGPHRLHNMKDDFTTFEITKVPGHTNILFHWGNYNKDSEGCVLVGKSMEFLPTGTKYITDSRKTFAELMESLTGINEFKLKVE